MSSSPDGPQQARPVQHGSDAHLAARASSRVLIAVADPEARDGVARILVQRGHAVVGTAGDGPEALGRTRHLAGEHALDAVMADASLPGLPETEVARRIVDCAPHVAVVMLTDEAGVERVCPVAHDGTCDVVRVPVAGIASWWSTAAALDATLRLAVARTRELSAARREAHQAREQLDSRKTIERAKGLLMRRTHCTEAEAQALLERAAIAEGAVPVVRIAQEVLDSEPGGANRRPAS